MTKKKSLKWKELPFWIKTVTVIAILVILFGGGSEKSLLKVILGVKVHVIVVGKLA